jgi:anti-anti-sigma factor
MLSPFTVERRLESDRIRIVVRGELDMETGPRLREELLAAEAQAPATLVLDLREVSFFDSTGLEILLDAEARARAAGRTFVVLPGDGEPRRVLELAQVTDRLTLEEPDKA